MDNEKIIEITKRAEHFIYVNYDDRNAEVAFKIIEELKELQKAVKKLTLNKT
jgi:hypothetical protein